MTQPKLHTSLAVEYFLKWRACKSYDLIYLANDN